MKIVRTPAAMARLSAAWDRPVALVPTMGALHAGHLALIDRARQAVGPKGIVAVSIFVNPLQFGPKEDLSKYPRPLRADLARCREHGVDVVFHPDADGMYAPGASVTVEESLLAGGLCGRSRPGHFRGVCTVVAKLFNLMRPDVAVFGQKDAQQLAIIRRMVRDLLFPVKILAGETVREPDGLALSSRNVYLNPEERAQAPVLRRALLLAAKRARAGERDADALRAVLETELATAPLARVDYAEVVDAEDLQPVRLIDKKTLLAVAVYFGRTRLIDNLVLPPVRPVSFLFCMQSYDFIIIGSGVAGLTFALKAAAHGRVAIITKRASADTNTAWAQGGVACVWSDEDSFELHVQDTLKAGAGLCDEAAVRTIVGEGPARIRELIALGVHFDERDDADGTGAHELDLTREGGHSRRRVLHSQDTTGREIENSLLRAVAANGNIAVLERHMAVDLITSAKLGFATENRCLGAYVLNEDTGEVETFRTLRTILATGGCGKVYLYTTNPNVATGDGVAMAWRAGATIANMEFVQFHPTCLFHPDARSFLISEAVRGEGGILKNARGEPFMDKYHPLASLAPRDIVARAIDAEMKRSGEKCVYLDITHQPPEFVRHHFPNIYETCLQYGIDITTQPIPVVPAAHYQCGGVRTDLEGATNIAGLYAIGEVACTGLHGANRLASNSLLEGLVLAHRASEACLRREPFKGKSFQAYDLPEWTSGTAHDIDELVVIYHNWDEIRRLMWDYVGIVRTDKRLQRAAGRLRNLQAEIQDFYWNFKVTTDLLELRNLATVAALIVDCALGRKESRGLHYTLDHPAPDEVHGLRDTLMRRY